MAYLGRVKQIWYLSPMRAAKVQASLRIRAVSPEPPLLAHTSSESRGTFRQKARSLASLNGWACAVKICLEDTNSLDAPHLFLNRAEVLKKKLSPTTKAPPSNNPLNKPTQGGKVVPPLGFGAFLDSDNEKDLESGSGSGQPQNRGPRGQSGQQGSSGLQYVGPKGYTKEEIDVLR